MRDLGAQVSAALQAQRQADQDAAAAQRTAQAQRRRLVVLHLQVAKGQDDLGRWAREAYAVGGPLAAYQNWVTALSGDTTSQVGHDLALLDHVGVVNGTLLSQLQGASAAQQVVARSAAAAAAKARDAQATAAAARARADALLLQQRQVLAALQAEQLRTVGQAQQASRQLGLSTSADALAAQAQLTAVLAARRAGEAGAAGPNDCQGLDTRGYANGEDPRPRRCARSGAPRGPTLRADAAAAFGACPQGLRHPVRPSVVRHRLLPLLGRSRSALFAAKPNPWPPARARATTAAAWPWTCAAGSSRSARSSTWLSHPRSALRLVPPAWAEPTGSRPEPWHWEFAG